ncbi:MAG: DNA mismatch repair endonuclease MutL [Lachnospiraceae bacterium]|nr:DNA mismatch repair endonuclease MutL [Lachnospiraceae bacterium]
MGKITLLSQETINQIAAGEVIERPGSVVKELMENALDAGATSVTVEIRDGGIGLIRVTDNGRGMASEDVRAAFLPHATSKIRDAQDLWHVTTLGFRGEALPSIAAVAKVELITREPDALEGTRIEIAAGKEVCFSPVGAPAGTTVIVRDLFYSAPVRLKFLKSPQTEAGYVYEMVSHIALGRPDISVRFIQNGKTRLFTSGNHALRDIVYSVYGRDAVEEMLPIQFEDGGIRLSGYLGKPSLSRASRAYETCFVNGRYARCAVVTQALEEAYKPYLMQHRFPFAVLSVWADPADLDVNVHPAKLEIRFRNAEEIRRVILEGVAQVLRQNELMPADSLRDPSAAAPQAPAAWSEAPEPFEAARRESFLEAYPSVMREEGAVFGGPADAGGKEPLPQAPGAASGAEQSSPAAQTEAFPGADPLPENGPANSPRRRENVPQALYQYSQNPGHSRPGGSPGTSYRPAYPAGSGADKKSSAPPLPGSILSAEEVQSTLFSERILREEKRHEFRIVGQVFDTYWIVEYHRELLIVDQHAAHEKVLYERFMKLLREKTLVPVQQLSPPLVLTLQPREVQLVLENLDTFAAAGFELEDFGNGEIAARAVPADFSAVDKKSWLTEMIDSLADGSGPQAPEVLLDKIASMSCKAAVKGNMRLSAAEMENLLDQMLAAEQPYTCPHGRPTVIRMSEYEMEKKFKRIV